METSKMKSIFAIAFMSLPSVTKFVVAKELGCLDNHRRNVVYSLSGKADWFSISNFLCRCDGIGRRAALKMPCPPDVSVRVRPPAP